MNNNIKKYIVFGIVLLLILAVCIGLLFAYRTDLFVKNNRDELTMELSNRAITIPLKHTYSFTSPTTVILKTNNPVKEICEMYKNSLLPNEKLTTKEINKITFIYFYVNDTFVQSIYIEPYGENKSELRIGVNIFIPPCLYEGGSNFSALFQDKQKLIDGHTYELTEKKYGDSSYMLKEYLMEIYEISDYNSKEISIIIDKKSITLKL